MIQRGGRSCLAYKPLHSSTAGSHLRAQKLDSHLAAQLGVIGLVHLSHAPATQQLTYLIPAKTGATPRPRLWERRVEVGLRLFQHRNYFVKKFRFCLVWSKNRSPFGSGQINGSSVEFPCQSPLVVSHQTAAPPPPNSLESQRFANVQRFATVRGEQLSCCAISSPVSPSKTRISITQRSFGSI